jgi:hypothetical protein
MVYWSIYVFGKKKEYKGSFVSFRMPKISVEKIERISEQILSYLYGVFPKLVFTVDVARDIARDEEFVKRLLLDLEMKGLVVRVAKNPKGEDFKRRMRWRISNRAYDVYSAA